MKPSTRILEHTFDEIANAMEELFQVMAANPEQSEALARVTWEKFKDPGAGVPADAPVELRKVGRLIERRHAECPRRSSSCTSTVVIRSRPREHRAAPKRTRGSRRGRVQARAPDDPDPGPEKPRLIGDVLRDYFDSLGGSR
jgi:hypothetical protein